MVILMLACGAALSFSAHVFAVFPFDLKISHELQEVKNPVFALVMEGVSALGDTWRGMVLIGTVFAFLLARGRVLEAVFVLATMTNFALTSLLKVLVGRPRPPDFFLDPADIFQPVNQFSFPSGHVLFFVVFFGFLAYLAWLHLTGYVRALVISACGTLILLIGASRVYLGAHWASDVLGSYVIGALWLVFLILGYQLASQRTCRPREN
jgi:undecaprenyl-diphosphatase